MDCFFHRKNEDLLIPWIFLGGFLTGDVFMLQFLDASPSCTASGRLGVSSTRCLKRGWTTKRAVTTWDFRLLNHTWLFGQHPEANSHRLFAPVFNANGTGVFGSKASENIRFPGISPIPFGPACSSQASRCRRLEITKRIKM